VRDAGSIQFECDTTADAYVEQRNQEKLKAYGDLIRAIEATEEENKRMQAEYQKELTDYENSKETSAQYERELKAHEDAYQRELDNWEKQQASYQKELERWYAQTAQIDNDHSNNVNSYYQEVANIDRNHQQALVNWEQQKVNIDKAHDKAISEYHQQVAAHQLAEQKQLDNHARAMKKYHDDRAKDPSMVVTVDKGKTLLAKNPFTINVTSQLDKGVTAVVYHKDRIKNGHGQIYIEDKRGRGEHSRTICINMLGNLKVVKGNESCP